MSLSYAYIYELFELFRAALGSSEIRIPFLILVEFGEVLGATE